MDYFSYSGCFVLYQYCIEKHYFNHLFFYLQREYTGHCNHTKIHQILLDHEQNLQEHEQLALRKLRIGIHNIVGTIQDLEVIFYLGIWEQPITLLNGTGVNKLVICFSNDGEVKYKWVARSLQEITKDFVSSFAKQVASVAYEILVNVSSQLVNQGLLSAGLKAIAWK